MIVYVEPRRRDEIGAERGAQVDAGQGNRAGCLHLHLTVVPHAVARDCCRPSTTVNVELLLLVSGPSVRLPVSIKTPGAGLPGASVPPATPIVPTVPVPPRVAPGSTVTALVP